MIYISCCINFWNQEVMLPHPVYTLKITNVCTLNYKPFICTILYIHVYSSVAILKTSVKYPNNYNLLLYCTD